MQKANCLVWPTKHFLWSKFFLFEKDIPNFKRKRSISSWFSDLIFHASSKLSRFLYRLCIFISVGFRRLVAFSRITGDQAQHADYKKTRELLILIVRILRCFEVTSKVFILFNISSIRLFATHRKKIKVIIWFSIHSISWFIKDFIATSFMYNAIHNCVPYSW